MRKMSLIWILWGWTVLVWFTASLVLSLMVPGSVSIEDIVKFSIGIAGAFTILYLELRKIFAEHKLINGPIGKSEYELRLRFDTNMNRLQVRVELADGGYLPTTGYAQISIQDLEINLNALVHLVPTDSREFYFMALAEDLRFKGDKTFH